MRTVTMIMLSVLAFFAHLLLSPVIAVFGAKIDFILIMVAALAFFTRKWYPSLLAAVYVGVAVDITTQAGTFINTGLYLFFGVTLGIACSIFHERNWFIFGVVCAACCAIKHLVLSFLLYIMRLSATLTLSTFFHGLPSVLYTGAAALLLYFVYAWIFDLSFMQEKKETHHYLE